MSPIHRRPTPITHYGGQSLTAGQGHATGEHAAFELLTRRSLAEPTLHMPETVCKAICRFAKVHHLTQRETQVLCLVCRGLKNTTIAEWLEVSVSAIRIHLRNMHEKLGTCDKLDLAIRVWHFYALNC